MNKRLTFKLIGNVLLMSKIENQAIPGQVKKYRLDVPQVTLLAHELKKQGLQLPDGILTTKELVEALKTCRRAF